MLSRTGALSSLGTAAVLAWGLSASAAPMSTAVQTATIPVTQTDWGPATPSLAGLDPVGFRKFDPTLGTLESVNLSLAYTDNHDVNMTFVNPSTITVKGDVNRFTVERPDGTPAGVVTPPDHTASQTYRGPTFPHSIKLPTDPMTGTSPITLTSPADLALFTRSAPSDALIRLSITADAHSSIMSSTSNGGGGSQVHAGAVVTLSYTYEPSAVPEPSTFAAFGLGFGGYWLARRNRRAAAG